MGSRHGGHLHPALARSWIPRGLDALSARDTCVPGTGTRDYDGNQLATGELKASVLAPGKWLQGAKSPWPEKGGKALGTGKASVAVSHAHGKAFHQEGCQREWCYGPPQPPSAGWRVTALANPQEKPSVLRKGHRGHTDFLLHWHCNPKSPRGTNLKRREEKIFS